MSVLIACQNCGEDKRHNTKCPLSVFTDTDTLVYLASVPDASAEATTVAPPTFIPHRVHIKNLLVRGSEYFTKLLQPRVQARFRKRHGFVERLPPGYKYILDLTPPNEGDEAVNNVTELSCPKGVRTWRFARNRFNVAFITQGEDEYESIAIPNDYKGNQVSSELDPVQQIFMPVDYSQLRHRAAIHQILCALEDVRVDPMVDTPCKLWTFFALAKVFDVAATPAISRHVLQWLSAANNFRFVEFNPELAYGIASGIKCVKLHRESFSIQVGEEALRLIVNASKRAVLKTQETVHGRVRETLDDTELQRIEYAGKTFVNTVLSRFVSLAGTEMHWLTKLPEYRKIVNFVAATPEQNAIAYKLRNTVKAYVRGRIFAALIKDKSTYAPTHLSVRAYKDYPNEDYADAYQKMQPIHRIFSRSFWRELLRQPGLPDVFVKGSCSIHHLAPNLPAFKGQEGAEVFPVEEWELEQQLHALNGYILSTPGIWNSTVVRTPDNPYEDDDYGVDRDPTVRYGYLKREIEDYLDEYAWNMMGFSNRDQQMFEHEFDLTDVLTCLSNREFKFLPRWAGGNDDGSGRVFAQDPNPNLQAGGLAAPGPATHVGCIASCDGSRRLIGYHRRATRMQAASRGGSSSESQSDESMEDAHDVLDVSAFLQDDELFYSDAESNDFSDSDRAER